MIASMADRSEISLSFLLMRQRSPLSNSQDLPVVLHTEQPGGLDEENHEEEGVDNSLRPVAAMNWGPTDSITPTMMPPRMAPPMLPRPPQHDNNEALDVKEHADTGKRHCKTAPVRRRRCRR